MQISLTPQIKVQAIVDPGAFEVADRIRDQPFLVTCFGELDGEQLQNRTYEIAAQCEADAAFEGMARYQQEMRRVN